MSCVYAKSEKGRVDMKLKFQFMKQHKVNLYQVESSLFMGGDTIIFESTSKSARDKEYKRYNGMDGDPYETIGKKKIKVSRYLKFKKVG